MDLEESGELTAEDRQQLTEIGKKLAQIQERLEYARINGYTAEIVIDAFFAEKEGLSAHARSALSRKK